MKKLIYVLLTGLALLVLPATNGYAQEKDCGDRLSLSESIQQAATMGYTNSVELTGSAAKAFLLAFGEVSGNEVSDEEITAAMETIDKLVIYINPTDSQIIGVRSFKDGCAIAGIGLPKEFYDAVMKKVELRASR